MKQAQKAAAPVEEQTMSRARYIELKGMLDERRREIHAEVQGKMRGVREEGAWVLAHLTRSGELTSAENRLLQLLGAEATSIPPQLRDLVAKANAVKTRAA